MNRAGIVEPRPVGGGTLATEPILVWRGAEDSDLQAYDQRGRWIGEAIRNRDRYSAVGCHFHYDISDVERWYVVTDTTKGRWRWTPKKFSITAMDGAEIAIATRPQPQVPWAFERHGEPIATLREVHPTQRSSRDEATSWNPAAVAGEIFDSIIHKHPSQAFLLVDLFGVRVAWISYLRIASLGIQNCLVIESRSDLSDPLPAITLAACVIANSTMIRSPNAP